MAVHQSHNPKVVGSIPTPTTKRAKLSASQIVHHALHWGEENITAMIDAHTTPDGTYIEEGYVLSLLELRRQMCAYRVKRFGKPEDPFKGSVLVDAFTTKFR